MSNQSSINVSQCQVTANLPEAIEAVIASATSKLAWASVMLQESTDIQQCIELNQLIQSTMATLEKAYQFRNK